MESFLGRGWMERVMAGEWKMMDVGAKDVGMLDMEGAG